MHFDKDMVLFYGNSLQIFVGISPKAATSAIERNRLRFYFVRARTPVAVTTQVRARMLLELRCTNCTLKRQALEYRLSATPCLTANDF